MPDFWQLSLEARQLWTWLQAHGLGRERAKVLPGVAAALGWSTRQLQQLAAELRRTGFPVVTARRRPPYGMFIATRQEDLDIFEATLTAITRDLEDQIRHMKSIRPAGKVPNQATLF